MVMDELTRTIRQFENHAQPALRAFAQADKHSAEGEKAPPESAYVSYRQAVSSREHAFYLAADAGRHFITLAEIDPERASTIKQQWTAEIERRIEASPQRAVFIATVFGDPPTIESVLGGSDHSA